MYTVIRWKPTCAKVRAVTVAVRDDENKSRLFIIDERKKKRKREKEYTNVRSLFSPDERLVKNSLSNVYALLRPLLHPRCNDRPLSFSLGPGAAQDVDEKKCTSRENQTDGRRMFCKRGVLQTSRAPWALIFPVKRGAGYVENAVPGPSASTPWARSCIEAGIARAFYFPPWKSRKGARQWRSVYRAYFLPERPRINSALPDMYERTSRNSGVRR